VRIAWFSVVAPALVLNYFGQGALLLAEPAAVRTRSTCCCRLGALPDGGARHRGDVIASQAVISGAFSLTRQASQLGFLPRMTIVHTSAREIGQVYMPASTGCCAPRCSPR
jgi:KUP system potassium uptake protein